MRTLLTRCAMCHCNELKWSALPSKETGAKQFAVHDCKNIRQQGSRTHSVQRQRSSQLQKYKAAHWNSGEQWNTLNATTGQFTTAKTSGCANVSSNSSRAEKVCSWLSGHPGLTVWNLPNCTRIETAHKVRKKTFVFSCGCYMYNYWGDRQGRRTSGRAAAVKELRRSGNLWKTKKSLPITCVSVHQQCWPQK